MVMELINYRYEQYLSRRTQSSDTPPEAVKADNLIEIPYFTDLSIACGHLKTSTFEAKEYRSLPYSYGQLNPARHFIARANGDSMNGGKTPIRDGDYLLLDIISSDTAGSISNQLVVIERQDDGGDTQFLLRYIKKNGPGNYTLESWNKNYPDMPVTEGMATRARVKSIINPLDLILHQPVRRKDIPPLFGLEFSQGLWMTGHICPKEIADQILLVTLNKQGQQAVHRYHDYFIDESTFHWQSQNSTSPISKKGKGVIEHQATGSHIHLFIRKNKLQNGMGAPFIYCGSVNYLSHTGSNPISVKFRMDTPLPEHLVEVFGIQNN